MKRTLFHTLIIILPHFSHFLPKNGTGHLQWNFSSLVGSLETSTHTALFSHGLPKQPLHRFAKKAKKVTGKVIRICIL